MRPLATQLIFLSLFSLGCAGAQAEQPADAPAIAAATPSAADTTSSGAARPIVRFPHLEVDVAQKQVRIECEAMRVDIPLEFFCVLRGTSDHETALRTMASPEQIHTALLMLGLKPGKPVHYSIATDQWIAPSGPTLRITCQFMRDGKLQTVPAYRMMRDVNTKKTMPPMTWVFAGSRLLDDGSYAANRTGYIVSIVNFELTVIDVPSLASSANETLEWEINPDVAPPQGTPVTMIIEPLGNPADPDASAQGTTADSPADASTKPSPTGQAGQGSSNDNSQAPVDLVLITVNGKGDLEMNHQKSTINQIVMSLTDKLKDHPVTVRLTPQALAPYDQFTQTADILRKTGATVQIAPAPPASGKIDTGASDDVDVNALKQEWEQAVEPHKKALTEAAQAHFQVIRTLRQRQQHLIDEADKLQRLIDQLERDYQQMTTPAITP